MASLRKNISSGLMIFGFGTMGASLISGALQSVKDAGRLIADEQELAAKYGITMINRPYIYRGPSQESINAYQREMDERLLARFEDPLHKRKTNRDVGGTLLGFGIAVAGSELEKARQFRGRIESRRGGRKEK